MMILSLGRRDGKSIIAMIAKMVVFALHLLNQHLKNCLYGRIHLIKRFQSMHIQEPIYLLKKQVQLISLKNSSPTTLLRRYAILPMSTRVKAPFCRNISEQRVVSPCTASYHDAPFTRPKPARFQRRSPWKGRED
jgi:hypothetical protein